MDSGLPSLPGLTNDSSGSTNDPPLNAPWFWLPPSWGSSQLAISNSWDTNAATLYDIRAQGYLDTNGPSPAPILYFVAGAISNLISSTDLISWSSYTFDAWISTNGMISVLYDGQGMPVQTNYGSGDLNGVTNTITFGIWVDNEPTKFFSVIPSQ